MKTAESLIAKRVILTSLLKILPKAIELNSEDANAYKNRGLAYGIKGNFDFAINDYTKAIELNPEEPTPTKIAALLTNKEDKLILPSLTIPKR